MQDDPPSPAKVAAPRTTVGRRIVRVVLVVIGLWIVASLVLPFFSNARGPARTNACRNNLRLLGIALQNYLDEHHRFPPAYIADKDGKPMHSWRVLILPFIGEEKLYKKYDFTEPWNGPHNRRLGESGPDCFVCPSTDGPLNETSYVVVVGPETMWPGAESMKVRYPPDGTSKTIAIVEVANSGINWMEPRDLTFEQALAGINADVSGPHISSNHPSAAQPIGAQATFADSHVMLLPNDLPKETLRALLTTNGGETADDPTQWP